MSYNANNIQSLDIIEAIRLRVGMYLSSDGPDGVFNSILEVISNAVDEYMEGHGKKIDITILPDDSIMVRDYGRGIPVDLTEDGIPAVEAVLTKSHTGGKFGKDESGYQGATGGLHGIGLKATNATSEWLDVHIFRNRKEYTMGFAQGRKVKDLAEKASSAATGTLVHFKPDNLVFPNSTTIDAKRIDNTIHELAFLCKGLEFNLTDQRPNGKTSKYCYDNGLYDFIKTLRTSSIISKPFYMFDQTSEYSLEIIFEYNKGSSTVEKLYTNHIPNLTGTHLTGFRTAMTRVMNEMAKKLGVLKSGDSNFTGEELREGLVMILSLKMKNPTFSGQTKAKLDSQVARRIVESSVLNGLRDWANSNMPDIKVILEKAVTARKARLAAQRARQNVYTPPKTKSVKDTLRDVMGSKLVDCQGNDSSINELFIVEGDSAGGSAKSARNAQTQAILPLKGKIINTFKSNHDRIMKNQEIQDLIHAIGTGIGKDFDIRKLRYDKILIMTDADYDGGHITALLLTFFYKYMPELIKTGHIYLTQPPLYKVGSGKSVRFIQSDTELEKLRPSLPKTANIMRFKGLGEMDADELWATTMNVETRILKQLTWEDGDKLVDMIFNSLMGTSTEDRKEILFSDVDFEDYIMI